MTNRKRTNNDPQNTTQKSKDRATWTPLKRLLRKGTQFLLQYRHPSCYYSYNPGDNLNIHGIVYLNDNLIICKLEFLKLLYYVAWIRNYISRTFHWPFRKQFFSDDVLILLVDCKLRLRFRTMSWNGRINRREDDCQTIRTMIR